MSILNTYFDKIYCINLEKRKDRWEEMLIEFSKHDINVEKFIASDGNVFNWVPPTKIEYKKTSFNGQMGCIASHVRIYWDVIKNNYNRVLIIEDDCNFVDNLNEKFEEVIKDVPEDWELLYFGGVHETRKGKFIPEKLTDNVVIGRRVITTTCYGITLETCKKALEVIKPDKPEKHTAIDGFLAAGLQPNVKTYAFHPPLAWQRASYSDIQNGMRDYSEMMKNNNVKD